MNKNIIDHSTLASLLILNYLFSFAFNTLIQTAAHLQNRDKFKAKKTKQMPLAIGNEVFVGFKKDYELKITFSTTTE